VIDVDANIIIPNVFDYIQLGGGVIAMNKGCGKGELSHHIKGTWTLLDYHCKEITPYDYEKVKYLYHNHVWYAKRDGRWYQIKPNEEIYFAADDEHYKRKLSSQHSYSSKDNNGYGQFDILMDEKYKGYGRKFCVRSCDGHLIHHFYYTPYLANPLFDCEGQFSIGDSIVNKYGQDMPKLNPLNRPKQKSPRLIFKNPNKFSQLNKDETCKLFVNTICEFDFDEDDNAAICLMNNTPTKQQILCDWILRKRKRNKNMKIECGTILQISEALDNWIKKTQIRKNGKQDRTL